MMIRKEIDNVPETNRKCGVILKNISVLKTDEIRKLCIPIFMSDTKAAMSSTNFKRCVKMTKFTNFYSHHISYKKSPSPQHP